MYDLLAAAHLLGSLVLRSVLEQHLEEREGSILVQGLREAVEGGGDLEPLIQDAPLPLNSDILWPFHEPMDIFPWGWSATHSCGRNVTFALGTTGLLE